MKFQKFMDGLLFIAKIISFLSLVMSLVIKTRILLGIHDKINKEETQNEN